MVESKAIKPAGNWLFALRRYLGFILLANLGWEILQLPLYTITREGAVGEIAFAVIHCTGGDLLIALSALTVALVLVGVPGWPAVGFGPVAAATVSLGVVYTAFSEWLNLNIRQSWAYADSMPIVPVLEVGLSPMLQWIIIPIAGLLYARRVNPSAQSPTPTPAHCADE